MPDAPAFGCCIHCEHDSLYDPPHDEPHDTPCDHGCNDADLEAMTDA